jgi:hypothetical protein
MNELVPAEGRAVGAATFPRRSRLDLLDDRVGGIAELLYRDAPGAKLHGTPGPEILAMMDAAIAAAPALLAEAAAARQTASKQEIAKHIAALMKSVPYDGGKGDSAFFGRQLAEDIGAQRPSIAALVLGCRNVRLAENFIPSIAKIVAEIKACEERLVAVEFHLEILPKHRAELARRLEG